MTESWKNWHTCTEHGYATRLFSFLKKKSGLQNLIFSKSMTNPLNGRIIKDQNLLNCV